MGSTKRKSVGKESLMEIRTKRQFYELWSAGVLGNKLRTWELLTQAMKANLDRYALREQGKAGGGLHIFYSRDELPNSYCAWIREGRKFFIAETAEDEFQILQGEVCRTFRGWEGTLGQTKLPMREAMAQGLLIPRSGAETRWLLRNHLDPSSLDDLDDLLDLYPDAVIEFTAFSKDIGMIPNRNTVMWEVRNY